MLYIFICHAFANTDAKNVIPKYSTSAVPQKRLFEGLKTIGLLGYDHKEGYISEFCLPVDCPYKGILYCNNFSC